MGIKCKLYFHNLQSVGYFTLFVSNHSNSTNRVHAKVDTVGEFKLPPRMTLAGTGTELILQMPKFLFWLWAFAATSRTGDVD